MAYPNLTSCKVPAQMSLGTSLENTPVENQTFHVGDTVLYEVDANGVATTVPLGQSGPFLITLGSEDILCSSFSEGVCEVYENAGINGRGWNETTIAAHTAGATVATLSATSVQSVATAGGISSVVAGSGIAVDSSNPANPVVSATGGGGGAYAVTPVSGGNSVLLQVGATGWINSATGINSISIAPNARATADGALALGESSLASAIEAQAIGSNSVASGQNSCAVTTNSTASAFNANALGIYSTASGSNSTTVGSSSFANGAWSVAVGPNGQANGDGQVVVGSGRGYPLAQNSFTISTRITANATPAALQNANDQFCLIRFVDLAGAPAWNKTAHVKGVVVARDTTTPGTDSAWSFEGVIRGDGVSAYTWIGGAAPTPTVIAQDAGATTWAVAITIGTDPLPSSAAAIIATVTGAAATNIVWECTLELDEVAG